MTSPDINYLSAPLWLVTTLHILTLTLHFTAMNFVAGGLIILVGAAGRNRMSDPGIQKIIGLLPTAMAATVTLGVAPLLFVQLVYSRQIYSSAIISGWFWLMIVAVAIVIYYLLYSASFRAHNPSTAVKPLLAIALAGALYISVAYSSIFSLAERPELARQLYARAQSGWIWNPSIGEYPYRWLHMILGAVAVSGFFITALSKDDVQTAGFGRKAFYWGMGLAGASGMVYLISLMGDMVRFMHTPGAWSLALGILFAIGAVAHFMMRKLTMAGILLFVSIFAMVMNRHFLRLVRLEGSFDPTTIPIAPQWSPFLLFVACLLIALALLAWMLRLYFRER